MTKRIFFITFFLTSILFFNLSIFGTKLITGSSLKGASFDYSIGAHCFYTEGDSYGDHVLYVAAGEAVKENKFAIARSRRQKSREESHKFEALTPAKVKFNGEAEKPNPLYGAKISFLSFITSYPVAVKSGESRIYFLSNPVESEKEASVYSSAIINDACKKPASQIIKLAVAEHHAAIGSCIFTAVKNNKGETFGADGSGIAMIALTNEKSEQEKKDQANKNKPKEEKAPIKKLDLKILNADANDKEIKVQPIKKQNNKTKEEIKKSLHNAETLVVAGNKAAPLTGAIDAIKINNDAKIESDIVDIHWDRDLKMLYVAVSVKSSNQPNSGARAIVVGKLIDNKIHFEPIAPNGAFIGNDKIVGTGQSNQEVSIYKIRSMVTSTLLNYLIVAGGNGSSSEVGNSIYALPVVNKRRNKKLDVTLNKNKNEVYVGHGALAKFDQVPEDYFSNEFFTSRAMPKPALNSEDLLTSSNVAAKVGRENLPLKPNEKITDMFVANDSVFVCIGSQYDETNQPGIYCSQAIFDEVGRISSWTKWQRVGGTDEKVFGASLDIPAGQFWYISGNDANDKNSVKVTQWGKDDSDKKVSLTKLLNSSFSVAHGGIQGIYEFCKASKCFNNFSMLIATGYKKIMLVETGSLKNGIYKPTKNYNNSQHLSFSNGALESIGSVICADIVANPLTNENWIIVGGSGGLAVLCNKDGRGWIGKIPNLNHLSSGYSFKKIGNYSFVQKIQNDGKFLYILTDKKLDKIELASANFKMDKFSIKTLSEASRQFSPGTVFNDFGVSGKFALLATSDGLYRVGNGRNIVLSNNQNEVGWTRVIVPEAINIISKLFFISPTGNESDFAQKGQVYILSSYRGSNESKINRFFVDLKNEVNDETIKPLNDIFVEGKLSNFFDFGTFREQFWTNGALVFSACSKDVNIELFLHILAPKIASGAKSVMISNLPVDLDIDKVYQLGRILNNSASGTLMISGSFGLRTNE